MQSTAVKPLGLLNTQYHSQRPHILNDSTLSGSSSPASLPGSLSPPAKTSLRRQSSLFISLKRQSSCRIDQLEEDQETSRHKVVGIGGAVLTLLQTAVGSTVLTLPYSLGLTGIPIGLVLMAIGLFINVYTTWLLVKLGELLQKRSFEKMAVATFGSHLATFFNICLVLDSLISVIVYLVIIKNLFPHALIGILGEKEVPTLLQSPSFWGAFFTLLCFFPLALLRQIKKLQHLGIVGFVAILYFVSLVSAQFFLIVSPDQQRANLQTSISVTPDFMQILSALPIHMYAFSYQVNVPAVHLDLKDRSLSRMKRVIIIAFILCSAIYLPIAIFGYLTEVHPGPIEANILRAPSYKSKTEFQVGFVIYVTMLLMTSTVRFRVGKQSVKQLLWKGKEMGKCGNLWLTFALVGVCLLFELLVPNIAIMVQILGSTTTPIICFIGPILLFLKTQNGRCRFAVVMGYVILVLLIVLSGLSFISSLINTFS